MSCPLCQETAPHVHMAGPCPIEDDYRDATIVDLKAQLAEAKKLIDSWAGFVPLHQHRRLEKQAEWAREMRDAYHESLKEAGVENGRLTIERDAALRAVERMEEVCKKAKAGEDEVRRVVELLQWGSCDGCGRGVYCVLCGGMKRSEIPEADEGLNPALLGHRESCPARALLERTR